MASVALPKNPLTADTNTTIASNTEYLNPPANNSPETDPQHSILITALMMINLLRSCLSTYVPPKTLDTCCVIIDAEPNQPAEIVEPETAYPINEIASECIAMPIAVAVSAVNQAM